MVLKIEMIKPKVYRVKGSTQQELGSTFVRFQEHYESPKFRNKIFTLGEFKDWYTKKHGSYSYNEDWEGFNIPSQVLIPFKQGLFDPLTKYEKVFLSKFKNIKDDFYIIGSNNDSCTLRHELSHALFFINQDYRQEVLGLLKLSTKKLLPLKEALLDMGYHKSVIDDEINAYLTTSKSLLSEFGFEADEKIKQSLVEIRRKYYSKWK